MRKFIYSLLASCFLLLGGSILFSQNNGSYDVRFVVQSVDCPNNTLFVDLEVRAQSTATVFNMGDQNYKFTYNRQAIDWDNSNLAELGFSGQVKVDPNNPNSLFQPYSPHGTIKIDPGRGSIALGIINVPWTPGRNGIFVDEVTWQPVSRLRFSIIDPNQTDCINLVWRDQSNGTHFTNITEVEATPPPGSASTQPFSTTIDASENSYASITACLTGLCSGTFPVEWTGFDVSYTGIAAEMRWSTAEEVNNDYFAVERSIDGVTFDEIGQVAAEGSESDYSFDDFTVNNTGSKKLYYRVRQYDVNGLSSTTNVVELYLDGALGVLGVYPNPAQDYITLQLGSPGLGSLSASIADLAGKVVQFNQIDAQGQEEISIDVSELSAGYYTMKIYDGISSTVAKFQIIR